MFEFLHQISHQHPWLFLSFLIAVGIFAAQVIARVFLHLNHCTMEQWKAYRDWS